MTAGASIYVKREARRWHQWAVAFRVIIDGRRIGELRSKQNLRTAVEPGSHRIRVRTGLLGWSNPVDVSLDVGDEVVLICGLDFGGFPWLDIQGWAPRQQSRRGDEGTH